MKMITMDVIALKQQLSNLPPEELKQLRAYIGARLQFVTEAPPATKGSGHAYPGDYLLDGIAYELSRRGIAPMSGKSIPTRVLPADYPNQSAETREYLEHLLPALKPADRVALGRIAAYTLAEWLIKVHIPVALRTMTSNVRKMPAALDDAFPGYLSAGLLSMVWRRGEKGSTVRRARAK